MRIRLKFLLLVGPALVFSLIAVPLWNHTTGIWEIEIVTNPPGHELTEPKVYFRNQRGFRERDSSGLDRGRGSDNDPFVLRVRNQPLSELRFDFLNPEQPLDIKEITIRREEGNKLKSLQLERFVALYGVKALEMGDDGRLSVLPSDESVNPSIVYPLESKLDFSKGLFRIRQLAQVFFLTAVFFVPFFIEKPPWETRA